MSTSNITSNGSEFAYSLLNGLSTIHSLEANPALVCISLAFNFFSTCLVIYMSFFKISGWSIIKFKSDEYYRQRIIVVLGSVVQRFSLAAMQVSQYVQPTNRSYVFLTFLNTFNLLYHLSSQLVLSLFILMTMGKEGNSFWYHITALYQLLTPFFTSL